MTALRLVSAELLKLRTTRSGWAFLATYVLVHAAGLTLVMRFAGRLGAPSVGTADHAMALLGPGPGATWLLLTLGVYLVTHEHRHATLTGVLLFAPDRSRLLAAKSATAAALGLGAVVYGLAVAVVVNLVSGDLSGVLLNGEVVAGLLGRLVALPAYGVLGVGIGALIRHQTVAVAVPLVWFLVIETLVPAYGLRWLVPWLPGGATAAMGRDTAVAGLLPAWAGALVLLTYVASFWLAGQWRLRRADIT